MPRPARRRQPGPSQGVQQPQEESQYSFDPADIIIGVVILIAVPAITYVVMSALGKPVSGRRGVTTEQALELKHQKKVRKPPPMQPEEVKLFLAHVDHLLETNGREYMERFKSVNDPDKTPEKDRWWQRANDLLKFCDGELAKIEDAMAKDSSLHASANYQGVISRRKSIQQDIAWLKKNEVFIR